MWGLSPGQGLGTAAVAESIRLVCERSGVDAFAAVTDGNVPSERLLAAVGFVELANRVGPRRIRSSLRLGVGNHECGVLLEWLANRGHGRAGRKITH